METIVLNFKGYCREVNWDTLSDVSAVYCIYACTYNKAESNLSIRELLYIGESEQLKTRVKEPDHQGIKRARKRLRDGEVLCLSYAKVDGRSRKRIENALIFEHQPICCEDDKYTYTHETVKIKTSGDNEYLSEQFVVEKGAVKRKVVNA